MSEKLYVRLKPYNPKQGFLVQNYVYGTGKKRQHFTTDPGSGRPVWYAVPAVYAAELAELRQEDNNPNAPALFDILDEQQYHAAIKREQDLRMVEMGIMTATAVIPVQAKPRMVDLSTSGAVGRAAALTDDDGSVQVPDTMDEAQPRAAAVPAKKAAPPPPPAVNEEDFDFGDDMEVETTPAPAAKRGPGRPKKYAAPAEE